MGLIRGALRGTKSPKYSVGDMYKYGYICYKITAVKELDTGLYEYQLDYEEDRWYTEEYIKYCVGR